jgi:hypothetical protein
MCSKTASQLLRSADLPLTPFIRKVKLQQPEPEQDSEAMILAAIEAAAKEAEKEEKRAKAARIEEASIRKKYSLVRQGSYHGVYNNEDATQVLFHTIEEAKNHLNDMVHGRDSFKIYYGSTNKKHRQPELQEIHY